MPGGFSIAYGQSNFAGYGAQAATSKGTVITASGSTNTKGSYTQITASTTYDAFGFWVYVAASATTGTLLDIAVGAAASEVVLVPNLSVTMSTAAGPGEGYFIPVSIPAGTRIAARCQSATASATVTTWVTLCDGSFSEDMALGVPQNYGASTSTSLGVLIDPGGSANTKGSYSQITASTTYDIGALQVVFDTQALAELAAQFDFVDLAVGAGGSEVIIVPNIAMQTTSGGVIVTPQPLLRVNIPAGSRIAARAQSTNSTSSTRKFGISLLGYQL